MKQTKNVTIGKEIEDIVIAWKEREHHTKVLGLILENTVGFRTIRNPSATGNTNIQLRNSLKHSRLYI